MLPRRDATGHVSTMSEAGRKALLVVNATSGHDKAAKVYTDALAATGITLIRREAAPAQMGELIVSMRHDVDCVVLAGGDSTLSAGAIALRDTGLPLGILPIGTDNDLAHTLSIPIDPQGAADVIHAGIIRPVTLGSVNGRPFFTVASVGLTVDGARRLSRAANASMSRLRFAGTAFRLLMQQRRFSAIIRCGSTVHRVRTVQITIGNGRLYSAGMGSRNQVHTDDNRLHVYSLEPRARWGLMVMSKLFAGQQDPKTFTEVRTAHSAVVEVVTRLPQPISADGEVVTVTPARFSMMPRAVRVYAPPVEDTPRWDSGTPDTGPQ